MQFLQLICILSSFYVQRQMSQTKNAGLPSTLSSWRFLNDKKKKRIMIDTKFSTNPFTPTTGWKQTNQMQCHSSLLFRSLNLYIWKSDSISYPHRLWNLDSMSFWWYKQQFLSHCQFVLHRGIEQRWEPNAWKMCKYFCLRCSFGFPITSQRSVVWLECELLREQPCWLAL